MPDDSAPTRRRPRLKVGVKLLLLGELVLLLLVTGMLIPTRMMMRNWVVESLQREQLHVAATAALLIDGDLHQQVALEQDPDSEAFKKLRMQLAAVAEANELGPDSIYTFFPDREAEVLRFGVMLHEKPFLGDPYELKRHQLMAATQGRAYVSDLFADDYGVWIAANAPIRNSRGDTVGLLEVARPAGEVLAKIDAAILAITAAALVGLLLASVLGYFVLHRTIIRPLRDIHTGLLALGDHRFQHQTDVRTGDELQDLGEALNTISSQLDVARKIQAGFVPASPPDAEGYRFAYRMEPCDATGGDYVDAFSLPDGNTAIVVADVTGHGLGPSLIMASCRSAMRALAATGVPPARLLDQLERQLAEDLVDGRFITMIFAVLQPDGRFTYANAGHAPAMLIRGGQVEQLDAHRPPLGIFLELPDLDAPPLDDSQDTVQLGPGDRVVFTSDGVNESQNEDNTFFGMEPIEAAACRSDIDADGFVNELATQLVAHRAGAPVRDDVTMLCVDRT